MAEAPEKTAEELAAEERELAIKRGDIIEDEETVEASAERVEESTEEEDDGSGEELEAADAEAESDAAEGESEEESPPEASAEGDAGAEEAEDIRIPKARFDEAQQKSRAKIKELEDKLKQTEQQHAQKQTNEEIESMQDEINELEDKWEGFLLEGEEEKAKAVRREVNAKRNEIVQKQLIQQSQQTGNAAVEQIRYETKLAIFEERYPQINPDSEAYNQAVEQEVGELKKAFEGLGWGSTAALEKAISYAIREEKTAPPPVEDSKEESTEVRKSQRAHKARKAAAEASKAMPPDASRAGRDSDKGGKGDGLPDVSKMTPDQFDKWAADNPSQMAQLRGDTLSADEAAA